MSSSSSSHHAQARCNLIDDEATVSNEESDEVQVLKTVIEVNGHKRGDAEQAGFSETKTTGQYRWFFFTINNPSKEHQDSALFWPALQEIFGSVSGGVYQVERAPSTKTLHLQGVFHLESKCRVATARNKMRSRALGGWIAPCIDPAKAVKYCSKNDTRIAGPFFFGDVTADGTLPTQGKRTDLLMVAQRVDSGASLLDVATAHPSSFIKYHHGITAYLALVSNKKERDFKTQVHWYHGAAGTGKTRRATWEAREEGDVYYLSLSKDAHVQWWKDYTGQVSVIIDDYDGSIAITEFFKMCDRYPYKVRTEQNIWVNFTSKHIYITSNQHPTLIYAKDFMRNAKWKEAFTRRIEDVVEFKEGDAWAPPDEDQGAAPVPPPMPRPPAKTWSAPPETDDPEYYDWFHATVCCDDADTATRCLCEEERRKLNP